MASIQVIVLDFDNCIALDENTREGSEEIKDRAWFSVFPEYDHEELNSVIEQVKLGIKGGKGDRRDIAEHVLKHFGFPVSKILEEVVRRCERFNAVVQEGIRQLNISPEVKESISRMSGRFPIYVNTATPAEAAQESLKALSIALFFKGVYGRPGTKLENMRNILIKESAMPKELLFVDDQQSGWETAQELGCMFVGIYTARNKLWHDNLQPFPIINSLTELLKIV